MATGQLMLKQQHCIGLVRFGVRARNSQKRAKKGYTLRAAYVQIFRLRAHAQSSFGKRTRRNQ